MNASSYGAYQPQDPKIQYTSLDRFFLKNRTMNIIDKFLFQAFSKDVDNRLLDLKNYYVHHERRFQHVLDVGCGGGALLKNLNKYFQIPKSNLEGIDIFPGIEKLGESVGISMRNLQLHELPAKEQYDLIVLSHVLEHVPDPKKMVQDVAVRLSDDGIFLLSIPNSQSLPAHLFGKKWRCHSVPRHIFNFSKKGILDITRPSFHMEHYSSGDYASNIYRLYYPKARKILGNFKVGKVLGASLLLVNLGDSQSFILSKKK